MKLVDKIVSNKIKNNLYPALFHYIDSAIYAIVWTRVKDQISDKVMILYDIGYTIDDVNAR